MWLSRRALRFLRLGCDERRHEFSVISKTSESCYRETDLKRKIVAFHLDEFGDWVADLECGHGQHVRHRPPWELRPWALNEEGRANHVGRELDCKKCDGELTPSNPN